ncbi:MAG: twin-arginine translocase TatA/TatE family subunit [Capsulimonadales bacterium]|nr:twin-arginine translocase TatA/TatE family subunit [Capsulimonadales bacterium]
MNNEWLWVVLIGVLLFGASNIPKLAKSLGEGIREFKKSVNDEPTTEPATDAKEK